MDKPDTAPNKPDTAHNPNIDWAAHYQAWQASGLTRRAYCAREGLKFKQYEKQIQRIRQSHRQTSHLPNASHAATPLTLLPVHIQSTPTAKALTLRHRSGWELSLNHIEPGWLVAVLKGLT